MEHFRNDGYGWTCARCSSGRTERAAGYGERARFFSEGEAEEREPRLADPARARWRDETQRVLYCPRCGATERVPD
ncbi:MAG TPA: hypothetical protein VF525_07325 [Pyrinomonadaceae bacterium]|jgi:hypothetical protein